ncbi:uncharacterized protein LOC108672385 [Hyalella azteca]|uniref:Uncharacterized protein LOC108672385 n=1 Tax=Hyalella azteca TaxID=294128 RepID=A0A8B7NPC1_HYAAZ|nr:uncharacterized protein LOC108672385 [Hyalella azteca]
MSRGFVLFIVAAAAASAQAADSACYSALLDASNAVGGTAWSACSPQYSADLVKYLTYRNCAIFTEQDAATCDSMIANYSKCGLKAAKLLKADNTFDDAAFKATTLQNKCSADAKFIAGYPTCVKSTMKYLNFLRLFNCLVNGKSSVMSQKNIEMSQKKTN